MAPIRKEDLVHLVDMNQNAIFLRDGQKFEYFPANRLHSTRASEAEMTPLDGGAIRGSSRLRDLQVFGGADSLGIEAKNRHRPETLDEFRQTLSGTGITVNGK